MSFFNDLIEKLSKVTSSASIPSHNSDVPIYLADSILFKLPIDEAAKKLLNTANTEKGEIIYAVSRCPFPNMFIETGKDSGYWLTEEVISTADDSKKSAIRKLVIYEFSPAMETLIDVTKKHITEKYPISTHENIEAMRKEMSLTRAMSVSQVVLGPTGILQMDYGTQELTELIMAIVKGNTPAELEVICRTPAITDTDTFATIAVKVCYQRMEFAFRVLQLLNCSNLEYEKHDTSEKLRKARKKKGKKPFHSFYTLRFSPKFKGHDDGNSGGALGLWSNRVHICRGHMKYYSPDKPLFGKYSGMFWWQSQLRGNKSEGIVEKDYEVLTE